MGIVFGVTGAKEPAFTLVHRGSSMYEIRLYPKYFVAEVPMNVGGSIEGTDSEKKNMDTAFGVLAKYIGVFGTPENTKGTL